MPCLPNSASTWSREAESPNPSAFKSRRLRGTRSRSIDQVRMTPGVTFGSTLKEPNVMQPFARKGGGPTSGASAGG